MIVRKALIKVWKKEFEGRNLTKVAKDIGINYRTLVSAIETGETIQRTVDKINIYILLEREKRKELLTEE